MRTRAVALLLLALAACGDESSDQIANQDVGRRDANAPASFGPDFAELELGPRLEGSEFEANFTAPNGARTGTLSGYVACPAGLASCDEAGEDAVYTYVLEVTPREPSSAFRTNERAYGFITAGYDKAAARAVVPGDSRLVTLCSDGVLVWAIDGGEGWRRTPVTLYWQSTSPPSEENSKSYVLITDGVRATATAPFPTEGSTDKCR